MTFTVTKAQEFTNPSDVLGMSNFTTDSFTNVANALHLFFYSALDQSSASPVIAAPTGGGTYTLVDKDGESDNWYFDSFGIYMVAAACYRTTIGASPSAVALTVDAWSGANTGGGWAGSCDIIGHDTSSPIVQSKVAGSSLPASGEQSGTVVLGAAPTNGNLLVVWTWAGSSTISPPTSTPSSPTAGSGKAMTGNLHTGHVDSRLDYRICDGTESATITCADLGIDPGNYTMVAVEVKLATVAQPKLYVPLIRRPHLRKMTGRA